MSIANRTVFLFLFVGITFTSGAWGQSTSSKYEVVLGTIVDEYNTPIPNLAVSIKSTDGLHTVKTKTDKNGNYVLNKVLRYEKNTSTLITYDIYVTGTGITNYESNDLTFGDDFVLAYTDNITITSYTSEFLVGQAWNALAQGDLNQVLKYTNECINLYATTANEMESTLTAFPVGKANIFNYWALNDVGTSYYIQGEAYFKAKMKDQGVVAYLTVVNDYYYAQVWSASGTFWKPEQSALKTLKLENYKTLYNAALSAVQTYEQEINLQKLPADLYAAVKAVANLQDYNQILSTPTGPGIYDYTWSLLRSAVNNKLATNNNIYTLTPASVANVYTNFFGQNFKVDEKGNIFVYASSTSGTSPGMIYEFLKAGGVAAIGPVSSREPLFAVRGNFLVAVDEPPYASNAVVSVFEYLNNAWAKVNALDITSLALEQFSGLSGANASAVSAIVLSDRALVVTLANGCFLVFNNYSSNLPSNPFYLDYSNQLGSSVLSVAADGSYIALGSSSINTVMVLQAKSLNDQNTQWGWQQAHIITNNDSGFGTTVALEQALSPNNNVTLTVGSTKNIYMIVKSNSQTAWPALKLFPLNMESTGSLSGQNELALKSNILVVPYTYTTTNFGDTVYTSAVMVYYLNSKQKWTWDFSRDIETTNTPTAVTVDTQSGIVVFAPEVLGPQEGEGDVFVISPKNS